jgi:phenylpyruvate tautomerase PptA (4-oxalocrotonate tautomerase family)
MKAAKPEGLLRVASEGDNVAKVTPNRRDVIAAAAVTALAAHLPATAWAADPISAEETAFMPLLRIDLYEGRSDAELAKLLDTIHAVMLDAFKVPPGDRYQIVTEHRPTRMLMEDTGLNIPRTKDFVMIQVTTRPRTREMKEAFYRNMAVELEKQCGVKPSDVMMNFVTCTDDDWSFGYGRAQFLTKEL